MSFEADLAPETHAPRVRMNLANGWSVSIVLTSGLRCGTRFHTASVAACPTGKWQDGKTELLAIEASSDDVARLLAEVASRPAAGSLLQ